MTPFTLYSPATAPESTKETMVEVEKMYGFVPNLYGYLAESPVALKAYLHINEQLMEHSSLSKAQVQTILLAISAVNECEFCVAAHSWGTDAYKGNAQTVEAIRTGSQVTEPKDAALVSLAQELVKKRGFLEESTIEAFYAAGFTQENLFDVLVCNMLKSLSNYTNHITKTQVNPELASFAR